MRCGLVLVGLLTVAGPGWASEALAKYDAAVRPSHRAHWAFQPVRPVPVPVVKDRSWVRNPIDAFILARLEARGWEPAETVSGSTLLRRVTLDLTGLPPTVEEQDAFAHDRSGVAYERQVERLLASPHHGERYARHWLDVARYADTNGYERDGDKPGAWRYRDWVIHSLNTDKPYNRFILEQLAGDELPDADAESILATGFLRLGPWDDEPADPKTDRFDQLDDMVGTTAEAFLGLTLACARCHNHKFEPLTMHDYYRLVAVFNPLVRPQKGRTELDRPALPYSRRGEIERLEERLARLRRSEAASAVLGASATAGLRAEIARLQTRLAGTPRGYFMEERSALAPATYLLRRGRADAMGPEVRPGVPTVLVAQQPEFLAPAQTTRRRLSLAGWITSKENPLTARVIVNRVWMWHFGEGLVRTPSDFGTRGERPTHPELLDWLAGWFLEQGGSLKKLHRLIVTSNTYRMSKRPRTGQGGDVENRLWGRFPYRRLEAEVIRDAILASSGALRQEMFGPGVRPPIPRAALEGHSDPNTVWQAGPPEAVARRTVYVHVKRSLMVPVLEALDSCDTTRSTARRTVTTVAPQALILFNGDLVNTQARHLAARLAREAGSDPDRQIDHAYRLLLCRLPTPTERTAVHRFLRDNGLVLTCRVLFNLNEFVYPD